MNKRLINVVVFVLTMIGVIVVSALINRIPHTAAGDAIWNPITRPLELFMRVVTVAVVVAVLTAAVRKRMRSRRSSKQVDPA